LQPVRRRALRETHAEHIVPFRAWRIGAPASRRGAGRGTAAGHDREGLLRPSYVRFRDIFQLLFSSMGFRPWLRSQKAKPPSSAVRKINSIGINVKKTKTADLGGLMFQHPA